MAHGALTPSNHGRRACGTAGARRWLSTKQRAMTRACRRGPLALTSSLLRPSACLARHTIQPSRWLPNTMHTPCFWREARCALLPCATLLPFATSHTWRPRRAVEHAAVCAAAQLRRDECEAVAGVAPGPHGQGRAVASCSRAPLCSGGAHACLAPGDPDACATSLSCSPGSLGVTEASGGGVTEVGACVTPGSTRGTIKCSTVALRMSDWPHVMCACPTGL